MPVVDAPSCLNCDSADMQYVESPEPKQDDGPWIVIREYTSGNLYIDQCANETSAKEVQTLDLKHTMIKSSTVIPIKQALASGALKDVLQNVMDSGYIPDDAESTIWDEMEAAIALTK